jgi:Ca2+-transporting ATPase
LGLLVYKDPLKQDIKETIALFKKAGIQVKMVTGDHALTGKSIAKEIGLHNTDSVLLGVEVINMKMDELRDKVDKIDVFARMFPDAKLKVIEALKLNGEIVAMTGDGVNDAPALKAAHIGISMGQSGTEIARESSSIVIRDDNLSHLVSAVSVGRKIYLNLKKAFRYIISIHIPIFLIVIIPILFNWKILNIFSPIHVIFLELIMGPTCSIIFEKEPIEEGVMSRKPISVFQSFISKREFIVSFFQGVIIAIGCLGLGYYGIYNHKAEAFVRTLIFITLLFSNIFLTLVNRSFDKNLLTTIRYRNNLIWVIIAICIFFIMMFVYNGLFNSIFGLQHLNMIQMLSCIIVGIFCTIWIEPFKKIINRLLLYLCIINRRRPNN